MRHLGSLGEAIF